MGRREAVVFTTHLFDTEIEGRIDKLRSDCADAGRPGMPAYDVFISAEPYVSLPSGYDEITHRFDFTELRAMAAAVIGDRIVPGNCHLRALDFRRRYPDYPYYWFVEYDLVYRGHWRAFLDQFRTDPSDLLATHVRRVSDDPMWPWISTFGSGTDHVDPRDWIRAFFPVHRMSAAGLSCVGEAVGRGWVGHHEMVVPTAMDHASLAIADIGGRGAWTPRPRQGRNYLDPALPYEFESIGSVRWRPSIVRRPVRNMLYHPCKTGGDTSADASWREKASATRRALVKHPRRMLAHAARIAVGTLRSPLLP